MKRPWQGKVDKPIPEERPRHDPSCYLCPGNTRAGGFQTPEYTGTYVFRNDFSALLPDPIIATRCSARSRSAAARCRS